MRWVARAGVIAVAACGGGGVERPAENTRSRTAIPGDSQVAAGPTGIEIWFTLAREASSPDGTRCFERGIEIRRGGTRLKVPLLYTGAAPVLLDDSTMRALLWNHCTPGDAYLVDLRTGHPVRERPRGKP